MTPREQEYSALRATIQVRGTSRVWIFVVGTLGWAGLAVATATLAATPIATLVPLMVIAATFEAVYALHVGVERIGRYLQVFHEGSDPSDPSDPGWEHVAMRFGAPKGAPTVDPLFALPFALVAILNLVPATLINPTREEIVFVVAAHALFLLRLVRARALAKTQRAIDLARFEQLATAERQPSRNTAS